MPGFSRRPLTLFVCCLFAGVPDAMAADGALGMSWSSLHSDSPATTPPVAVTPTPAPAPAAPTTTADNPPLHLHVQRKFNILSKKKAPAPATPPMAGIVAKAPPKSNKDAYPLFVIADRIEGQTEQLTKASGHAELRKIGSLLFADYLTYWPLDDQVEATGSVHFEQDGAEFDTPHLRTRISDQIGFAEKATYHIVREVPSRLYDPNATVITVTNSSNSNTTSSSPMMLNVANSYGLPTKLPPARETEGNGTAERIDFEGENQMTLTQNTYSSCKPGRDDWYMASTQMHLDYDKHEGMAKNASLWFQNVPILYSPVISFPLDAQRRSGILHPYFSASTRNGLDLTLPYYWNIAPNYDLTILPRYMMKRGMQLGADARYLGYNYEGEIRAEYLPNDELLNRSRYAYRIDHRQNLGRGFSALVNWNGVSDNFYWQDLSSRLLQTSQAQLPRQVMLGYTPTPWLQTNLQVLRYQTLQTDTSTTIAAPYFLEPQLNLVATKSNVMKTDLSAVGQFTRFTNVDTTKTVGDRFVFYPQVSLPIVTPAFQITPKIGLHMSKYALDNQLPGEPDSITRVLPTFSVDSTVVFEREGNLLGKSYIQTLEPRLYYVNIPYKDQSQIPLFDTALSDFNFAQIFSENRYSGYDRINDANQLTAAVSTRFLDGQTGVERFKAMLGQRYYFKPQRVVIAGETSRQTDFSDLVAAANGLVAHNTYVDLAWEYNYHDNVSERFSAGVRFQPDYGKVLSASYRYTRDTLTGASTVDQVDFAGQWPLAPKWYAVGRYNYSLRDRQLLETIAGVEYNAGCWSMRVVGQRLEAIAGSPNTSFFVQLELLDFGSIGSNPVGLLRRSIPGYGKINELPDSGRLLTTQ